MTIDPFSSLTELSQALSDGSCTAVDVAELYLDRIARLDGYFHAFVQVDAESVRLQARASDLRRQSGHTLGVLDGVPIAVKDLFDIEGVPGSCGSLAWAGRVGTVTSTPVRRLCSAGAVILGKTHMVEFAFGGWGTNRALGTPRNPWDMRVHRVPGGSSSGSGVAVAAGLAPAALGSDTGGSVRIPAALVGITGLKTSSGLISRHGVVPLSDTLDTVGPMTRSVADAALLIAAIAGADVQDPATQGVPLIDYCAAITSTIDLSGMRLVLPVAGALESFVQPSVLAALQEAEETFRGLGADVRECLLPFSFEEFMQCNGQIICAEAWRHYGRLASDSSAPLNPEVRARIKAGEAISSAQYIEALDNRRLAQATWSRWMDRWDALLTPTLSMAACPIDEVDEASTPLSMFTRAGNYLGACALSLPAGFSDDGLPVGVQLMARAFDESKLIRLGCAFQAATQWHRARYPQASES